MDRRQVLLSLLAIPTLPLVGPPGALSTLASSAEIFRGPLVAGAITTTGAVDRTREFLGILHSLANGRDVDKIWDAWFGWDDRDEWDADKMFFSLLDETAADTPSANLVALLEGMRERPTLLESPMSYQTYIAREDGDDDWSEEVVGVEIGDVAVILSESGESWAVKVGSHVHQGTV